LRLDSSSLLVYTMFCHTYQRVSMSSRIESWRITKGLLFALRGESFIHGPQIF